MDFNTWMQIEPTEQLKFISSSPDKEVFDFIQGLIKTNIHKSHLVINAIDEKRKWRVESIKLSDKDSHELQLIKKSMKTMCATCNHKEV